MYVLKSKIYTGEWKDINLFVVKKYLENISLRYYKIE